MPLIQTEGIVLKSLPFQEKDLIVTLFTPCLGILKLLIKKTSSRHRALTETFSRGEFIYVQGKSSLYRFYDGTVLNQHLFLRDSLVTLETAFKLAQSLLQTQWQGKPAHKLYTVFRLCLEKLRGVERPEVFHPLFLLKILKYEGVLQTDHRCSCQAPGEFRFGGENFCKEHAPSQAIYFSDSEKAQLQFLIEERSFQRILSTKIDSLLYTKIEQLFSQNLSL